MHRRPDREIARAIKILRVGLKVGCFRFIYWVGITAQPQSQAGAAASIRIAERALLIPYQSGFVKWKMRAKLASHALLAECAALFRPTEVRISEIAIFRGSETKPHRF